MKSEDSMTTRRRYTDLFKAEDVRLVRDSKRPDAQVAPGPGHRRPSAEPLTCGARPIRRAGPDTLIAACRASDTADDHIVGASVPCGHKSVDRQFAVAAPNQV
jgi:hypothetical protein